jgi:hypothetical protein
MSKREEERRTLSNIYYIAHVVHYKRKKMSQISHQHLFCEMTMYLREPGKVWQWQRRRTITAMRNAAIKPSKGMGPESELSS